MSYAGVGVCIVCCCMSYVGKRCDVHCVYVYVSKEKQGHWVLSECGNRSDVCTERVKAELWIDGG